MTELQFERWKDFAQRMARVCYAASWRPSSYWILDKVETFFEGIEDDDEFISSIINWDNSRNGGYGVGDRFSMSMDDCGPYLPNEDAFTLVHGVEREVLAWEQYDEQWLGPVHCCVRAGLDLASAPSAGVRGFTVGHICKMYPEGVPDWIAHPAEPWIDGDKRPVSDVFAMAAETPIWL